MYVNSIKKSWADRLLSGRLFVCLPIHSFIYLTVCSFVRPFILPSFLTFLLPLTLPSVQPHLRSSIHPSFLPFVRLTVHPFVYPRFVASVRMSVCPSVCPSIHLSILSPMPSSVCLNATVLTIKKALELWPIIICFLMIAHSYVNDMYEWKCLTCFHLKVPTVRLRSSQRPVTKSKLPTAHSKRRILNVAGVLVLENTGIKETENTKQFCSWRVALPGLRKHIKYSR